MLFNGAWGMRAAPVPSLVSSMVGRFYKHPENPAQPWKLSAIGWDNPCGAEVVTTEGTQRSVPVTGQVLPITVKPCQHPTG